MPDYENGERFDPARPLVPSTGMRLCPVDNCVVDKIYTDITQEEIHVHPKEEDSHYEYCSVSTTDGDATLICDAAIFRESPVLASLIDVSCSIQDSSSIQFSKDLLQARVLPIIAEKLVFQHTWKDTSYGDIPRDPTHYREMDAKTELALFIALDTLEL